MPTSYATVASLGVGLVLPLLIAVFTRPSTPSTVKGIAHAVLAVATGFAAVYQAHPQGFSWTVAVVAAFLAWFSGSTLYHSLLKKYRWVGWLQNLFVSESKIVLGKDAGYFDYLTVAENAEADPVNNFPLSTDTIQQGVEEAVHAAEEIPVVGTVVHDVAPAAIPAIVSVVDNVTYVQQQPTPAPEVHTVALSQAPTPQA